MVQNKKSEGKQSMPTKEKKATKEGKKTIPKTSQASAKEVQKKIQAKAEEGCPFC